MDTPNSAERAGRIAFFASLPLSMRQEVEALFFFNPRQPLLHDGIHATVAQSGMPAVVENDGKVWIDVPPGKTQCLFACDEGVEPLRVVGVALYSRPGADTIAIDHMAIDPDYVHGGENAALDVAMHLVGRVMAIAGSIKGVTRIQLPYRGGATCASCIRRLRGANLRADDSAGDVLIFGADGHRTRSGCTIVPNAGDLAAVQVLDDNDGG